MKGRNWDLSILTEWESGKVRLNQIQLTFPSNREGWYEDNEVTPRPDSWRVITQKLDPNTNDIEWDLPCESIVLGCPVSTSTRWENGRSSKVSTADPSTSPRFYLTKSLRGHSSKVPQIRSSDVKPLTSLFEDGHRGQKKVDVSPLLLVIRRRLYVVQTDIKWFYYTTFPRPGVSVVLGEHMSFGIVLILTWTLLQEPPQL